MSKRSLVAIILILCMSLSLLVGCGENEGATEGDNSEVSSVAEEVNSEETVSEEVSETVSEEAGEEMTIEEIIASEIPAKLEVGEDEVIVPATVTAEQILARWEEVKVTECEYSEEIMEEINKEYLAGLLCLNCSYMDPEEFQTLVDEYFSSWDEFKICNQRYEEYNIYDIGYDDATILEVSEFVKPSDLLFDEYLIHNAEQVEYIIEKYNFLKIQSTPESSPVLAPVDEVYEKYEADLIVLYNIIDNYCSGNENKYLTFDWKDERLEGSGTAWCFQSLFATVYDEMFDNDESFFYELCMDTDYNEYSAIVFRYDNIIEEQYNK